MGENDALRAYHGKRDLGRSGEPSGGRRRAGAVIVWDTGTYDASGTSRSR